MSTPGRARQLGDPIWATATRRRNIPTARTSSPSARRAIYAAGSWDITTFEKQSDFEFGAFPPPVAKAGDTCYISDHTDIAIGLNAEVDQRRCGQDLPGLGRLARVRRALLATRCPASSRCPTPRSSSRTRWRRNSSAGAASASSTIRNSYQILSRGTPNLENELWNVTAQVMNGTMKPDAAAAQIQKGLDSWYKPNRPATSRAAADRGPPPPLGNGSFDEASENPQSVSSPRKRGPSNH